MANDSEEWDLDITFRARQGVKGYLEENRWVGLDYAQFHSIETVLVEAKAKILAIAAPEAPVKRAS